MVISCNHSYYVLCASLFLCFSWMTVRLLSQVPVDVLDIKVRLVCCQSELRVQHLLLEIQQMPNESVEVMMMDIIFIDSDCLYFTIQYSYFSTRSYLYLVNKMMIPSIQGQEKKTASHYSFGRGSLSSWLYSISPWGGKFKCTLADVPDRPGPTLDALFPISNDRR